MGRRPQLVAEHRILVDVRLSGKIPLGGLPRVAALEDGRAHSGLSTLRVASSFVCQASVGRSGRDHGMDLIRHDYRLLT